MNVVRDVATPRRGVANGVENCAALRRCCVVRAATTLRRGGVVEWHATSGMAGSQNEGQSCCNKQEGFSYGEPKKTSWGRGFRVWVGFFGEGLGFRVSGGRGCGRPKP